MNATASEVEHIVRDCLFDQIPESSINELVDFFIFERRLYLKNSGLWSIELFHSFVLLQK